MMQRPEPMAPQEDGTMEEVPFGAMPEEVADDIDAKLSEGEFVVPADVVRWVGLKSLMAMREEAKVGLATMEAEGQVGGSPVASGGGFAAPASEMPLEEEAPPESPEGLEEPVGFAEGGFAANEDYYTRAANQFRHEGPRMERYLDEQGRIAYRHLDAEGNPIGLPPVSSGAGGQGMSFGGAESESKPIDYAALMPQQQNTAPQAPSTQGFGNNGGPGDDSGDPNHGAGEHEMDPDKSFGENLSDWGGKVGFGLATMGTMMSPAAAAIAGITALATDRPMLDGTTKGTFGSFAHQNLQSMFGGKEDGWSSRQSFADQTNGAALGGQTGFDFNDPNQWSGPESEISMSGSSDGGGWSGSQSFGGANIGGQTSFGGMDASGWGGPESSIGMAGGYSSSSPGVSGGGGGSDGNNGAGGSSDSRVICTHFYKQGELARDLWAADTRWTMENVSLHTQRGYQLWGVPYVRLMRRSRIAEAIVRPLALHRAEEIGYKLGLRDRPDYIGKLGRVILEGISWFAGWLPMEPVSYKTLYTK